MAVATSFVKHLADPAPLKTANIQVGREEGRGTPYFGELFVGVAALKEIDLDIYL